MLASGACVIGGDHIHDAVGQPMQFSGRPRLGSTHIARDVWIGRNALVMAGTAIGEGAIVAAGAVVTKDVRPYTVVAGVPATFVRNRFADDELETEHSRVINGPLLRPSFAGPRLPEDVDG
ncbi:acetyltransferase [Microbacterium sp. A93]|uniref:acetyltransferase n=1 Tax=Microbacterium sp. A93 TaxID=3450716 RepID=UPI003F43FBA6